MADVLIKLPDGSLGRFPDTMDDVQIKGIIAHAFPKEVGAAVSAQPERDKSKAFPFDGSSVPGYDPKTGIVAGGPLGDSLLGEVGTGARQALEGAIGIWGDLPELMMTGAEKLADYAGVPPMARRHMREDKIDWLDPYVPKFANSQDIANQLTSPLLGEAPGEPLTTEGKAARAVGNFSLGALAPGGPLRKAASVLLPAAFSEGGAAAAEGTGYEDYARLFGGLAGGALTVPRVGVAGTVKEAAKDLGVETRDLTKLIKRMQQDGLTPDQIKTRLDELGSEATLMDVGPNLRQEGQRIYAQGGRGRGIIDDALTPRDKSANARIRSDLDANLGPAPVPSKIDAGLRKAQKALGPEYERKLANTAAADTPIVANELDTLIENSIGETRSTLEKVRGYLNMDGSDVLDPSPRRLLAVRQEIDDSLGSPSIGANTKRLLREVRKTLDGELEKAAPGIKETDRKFMRLAQQREAVERGQTVLDSGRTSPRPDELADELAKGGPAVQRRMSQGARAEIDRIVGTNANDRVALQRIIKGDGDWNREKLGQLFGQDKADRMIKVLEREGTFADTSNRVMKNSATAERLSEGGQFGVKEAVMSGGPKAAVYSGVIKGVEAVLDKMRGAAAAAQDGRMARLLTNTNAQQMATALLKANGGKPLPIDQIETRLRALLQVPGASASNRQGER